MKKIIDGDRMVIVGYFDPDKTEETLEHYRNDGRWDHVETDHEGDIILFEEE